MTVASFAFQLDCMNENVIGMTMKTDFTIDMYIYIF